MRKIMILGSAAWGFRETPLEEQLKITQEMGLSLLELSIGSSDTDTLSSIASKSEIAEVKAIFDRYNVKLLCASTGNDFTLETSEENKLQVDEVRKAIDTASELGIKYMRIFAGFSPYAEVTGSRWEIMIESLNDSAKYAKNAGIELAIETHGGVKEESGGIIHFHSTSSKEDSLIKMLEQSDTSLGLVFDPANLGAVGYDENAILALFHKVKDRISYMHLKDFEKINETALAPCACGDGQLDWSALYQTLKQFPGPGFIEYELPEDVEDGLKRSLLALKE